LTARISSLRSEDSQSRRPKLTQPCVVHTALTFYVNDDAEIEHEAELPEGKARAIVKFPLRKLRGRELQVIPKIVDYKLEPGETHEGA